MIATVRLTGRIRAAIDVAGTVHVQDNRVTNIGRWQATRYRVPPQLTPAQATARLAHPAMLAAIVRTLPNN